MKKMLAMLLAVGLCLGSAACASDTGNESSASNADTTSTENQTEESEKPEESKDTSPLSEAEIQKMYSDPEAYTDRTVTLTGEVFTTPEVDDTAIYFQMFHDTENADLNTVVAYADPDFEVEDGDYVKLTGVVMGAFEGTNAFGNTVTVPQILATTLEVASYADIVAPALQTVTPKDASITQHGYTVTVTKVEFAEKETRLYLTVENAGKATFKLYSFNAKIVQNGKQYEEETNYDADYPEVQSDLLPGVTSEGIIAFPAMDPADLQVVLDAHSDDYDEDFELYTFDIAVE